MHTRNCNRQKGKEKVKHEQSSKHHKVIGNAKKQATLGSSQTDSLKIFSVNIAENIESASSNSKSWDNPNFACSWEFTDSHLFSETNYAKNKCFDHKFNETATLKIEKKYDTYITYFSNFFKQLITAYSGSIFVRHCASIDLLHHVHSFLDSLSLSSTSLINISMDYQTVNQSLLKQLKIDLEESEHSLIDIAYVSCKLLIIASGHFWILWNHALI